MRNRGLFIHHSAFIIHHVPLVAFLCVALLVCAGFIHKVYTVKEIMDESSHIMVGKIESVDKGKKRIVARVERQLKGKSPFKKVQMNIALGDRQFHTLMTTKIRPGHDITIFYQIDRSSIACLCYVDGFWFQLFATDDSKNRDRVWWRFSHVEIYMTRTFRGSQAQLIRIVQDILAGKSKGPKPNTKMKKLDVKAELARKSTAPASPAKTATKTVSKTSRAPAADSGRIFGRQVRLSHPSGEACGVSWVDYDGDGDLDAYVCCASGNRLYRYDGGTKFRDVTRQVGLGQGSRGASWADYNGDGRLDLLLSTPKLYTNLGGKFRDDTRLLPKLPAYNTEGCGWIDYDGDGAPDVLLTNGEHGIAVFKNEQRDRKPFRDVSRQVGLGPKGPGNANGDFLSIADWDGDGFSDFLYNVGQGLLCRNNGEGRFVVAQKTGLRFSTANDYKIGTAWGDYDNDGDLDLFVPQNNIGKLFRNNNDGTFSDVTKKAGDLARIQYKWTVAVWGDVNGDGRLDLYVGKADGDSRLFINQTDGTFVNQVKELGLYHLPGNRAIMGVAFGDYDGDGDLDILANSIEGQCTVFINDLKRPASGPTYLLVRPARTVGAVGATVRLFDQSDRLLGLHELGVAQNMGSQVPMRALFGVPKGKYKVTICMSDGGFGEKIVEVGQKGLAIAVGAEAP